MLTEIEKDAFEAVLRAYGLDKLAAFLFPFAAGSPAMTRASEIACKLRLDRASKVVSMTKNIHPTLQMDPTVMRQHLQTLNIPQYLRP